MNGAAPDTDVVPHLERGARCLDAGDLAGAEAAFLAALAAAPDEHRALFGAGLVDLRAERWLDAWQKAHRAIRAAPGFAEAYHLAGEVMRAQRKLADAVALYRQALALKPAHHESRLRLGLTLAQQGRLAEAAETLQRMLLAEPLLACRDLPAFAHAHRLLGALWQQLGVLAGQERRRTTARPARRGIARPRILVVCPRWHELGRDRGPSLEHQATVRSLEASGLAEVVAFAPDEQAATAPASLDAALMAVRAAAPDAVVYTPPAHTVPVSLEALRTLRAATTAPLVLVHTDSASPWNIWAGDALLPVGDLDVTMDGEGGFRAHSFCPWAYLALWTPLDATLFRPGTGPRDLDVCFVGTVDENPERVAALAGLRSAGIPVFVRAGGAATPGLSLEEYAALYRRAKIVLNFSHTTNNTGAHHLKGRVFEAMASGAMVLESANPETARLFEPDVDYVAFADHEDLARKIRAYLADDGARAAVAARGQAKVAARYTARTFWEEVLVRAGLVEAVSRRSG